MELNSGPSAIPDRTSDGKKFNLADLVLIIGYRLTAYRNTTRVILESDGAMGYSGKDVWLNHCRSLARNGERCFHSCR
jgi:hypothetical protein